MATYAAFSKCRPIRSPAIPAAAPVVLPGVHWVEPKLVAEITYLT
jgi:hypothetical protein